MNTHPEPMPSWWQPGEDAWNEFKEKIKSEKPSIQEDTATIALVVTAKYFSLN